MTPESLSTLRLRRVGLAILASRGNADAIARLALLDQQIKALAAVEEPLFGRTN